MLSVSFKHGIDITNCIFDAVGTVNIGLFAPHGFDELGVVFSQFTFGPDFVFLVNFSFKELSQEVVG